MKPVVVALLWVAWVGDSPKQRVDLFIRKDCLVALHDEKEVGIRLEDCDLNSEPPKCGPVHIKYRAECAEIRIVH